MKCLDARINYSSFGNWVSIDKVPDEVSDPIRIEIPEWLKVSKAIDGFTTIVSFKDYPEDSWCWADGVIHLHGDKLSVIDWRNCREYGLKYEIVKE